MKKILILIGLLIPLIGFSQKFSKRLDQVDAPSDTFKIILDDTARYLFEKDTFSAPNIYFDFLNASGGSTANLTDSTLTLFNSSNDSIILKLDTASFDSTHIDVLSMSIGGGDVLASSDTVNTNDIIYSDTMMYNSVNVIRGTDSTYATDKFGTWIYGIGKPQ